MPRESSRPSDRTASEKPAKGGFGKREVRRAGGEGRPAAGGRPAANSGNRPAGKGSHGRPTEDRSKPSRVAGVDRRLMERLASEGMLSAEGRRALGGEGDAPKIGAPVARTEAPQRRVEQTHGKRPAAGRAGIGRPAMSAAETAVAQRLQKVMAQAGVASRRNSEELIQAGRVAVNGQIVTELGTKVVPGKDRIELDGRPLGRPEEVVYILLNKPKGYVTTLFDPQGRPKVVDLLGGEVAARVYPVGRLDFETEGLLLLTNDGEVANALMHPAREVKKTYIAKVRGVPGPAKLKALESGIELEDGVTAPADVRLIEARGPNAATVSIRIHEGRNRQVRRMFEAVGHEVIHLKRTTLGPLHLKDLAVGQWRELSERELRDLQSAVGLNVAAHPTGRGVTAGHREGDGGVSAGRGRTAAKAARRGGARFAQTNEPVEATRAKPSGRPSAPQRDEASVPDAAPRSRFVARNPSGSKRKRNPRS